jgi:hypothetical protein
LQCGRSAFQSFQRKKIYQTIWFHYKNESKPIFSTILRTQKDHGDVGHHVRHVGDLGNVDSMGDSFADIFLFDHLISLSSKSDRSVLHRALVIHEKADDLGLGNHADSKKTGNSGSRVACGIITLTPSRIPFFF